MQNEVLKFSSVKEMEENLKSAKTIKDINYDIEVLVNGDKVYLDKVGNQILNNTGIAYWVARENAQSLSLDFEILSGEGYSPDDTINVTRTHFVNV